jgi:hypothetical protein
MVSSEVQRTLVKSPPELWAELSDPAALARHLGELGEIRITRIEAEKTVEWEAKNTTGTVSIQPSGWGTRVTLSVTREIVGHATGLQTEPESAYVADGTSEPDTEPEARAPLTSEPEEIGAEPDANTAPDSAAEPVTAVDEPARPAVEPEHSATEPKPTDVVTKPRRGFFARLFGRQRKTEAPAPQATAIERTPGSTDAFTAVREALTTESFAGFDPFAVAPSTQQLSSRATEPQRQQEREIQPEPEQTSDIAAELRALEEAAEEEVRTVLAAVLDRLGAAHHRPFSRT